MSKTQKIKALYGKDDEFLGVVMDPGWAMYKSEAAALASLSWVQGAFTMLTINVGGELIKDPYNVFMALGFTCLVGLGLYATWVKRKITKDALKGHRLVIVDEP